jgi:hypothetical protein
MIPLDRRQGNMNKKELVAYGYNTTVPSTSNPILQWPNLWPVGPKCRKPSPPSCRGLVGRQRRGTALGAPPGVSPHEPRPRPRAHLIRAGGRRGPAAPPRGGARPAVPRPRSFTREAVAECTRAGRVDNPTDPALPCPARRMPRGASRPRASKRASPPHGSSFSAYAPTRRPWRPLESVTSPCPWRRWSHRAVAVLTPPRGARWSATRYRLFSPWASPTWWRAAVGVEARTLSRRRLRVCGGHQCLGVLVVPCQRQGFLRTQ